MRFLPILIVIHSLLIVVASTNGQETQTAGPITVAETDWPWWRGPSRNGIAVANQQPPLRWSESENVLWKSPVPGRGHGSPTVHGDRVFLATAQATPASQSVLCFDRLTGKRVWTTIVHRGGLRNKNKKASLASATIACDGERLFVNFLNDGAVYTTALDRDGNQLWQTKICDYVLHQGFASSPAIYDSLVIVAADNKGGGAIAGLDRASGQIVWKQTRPKTPNYASPIILKTAGREQLLFTGCNLVSSFAPLTGKKLWETEGSTTECVTSIVTDGKLVFTSGGYPRNHVSALHADGSGRVAWENSVRVYVPSMLVHEGHLFAVTDAGVATCWKADSGKEIWKGRLGGGFSGSPILVGKRIYVTNEKGKTFVFAANPNAFELLGESQLGNESFATPAICGGQIYLRTAKRDGEQRSEYLYCIAADK